jgi:Fe2+ transport system protein B
MSKAETLRQLAASANAKKLEGLSQQIETLRMAKLESAEQLAEILEPLAQAMAALTDETRQTLESVEAQAQQQAERISRQIESAAKVCQQAAMEAQRSADRLDSTGRNLELSHIFMTVATGIMSALLVSALWLWLAPQPNVMNQLDAKQVAEYLVPAIAATKPSKGK